MKADWNPWPVGLALSLACVLVGVITFSIFAHRHAIDLVTPDYYQEEIAFQQQIDRRQRTAGLTHRPLWSLHAESQTAVLGFAHSNPPPAEGLVHLYRPSDSTLDQTIPLALDQTASQQFDLGEMSPGLWVARLTWKTEGEEYYHEERWELPVTGAVH